MVEVTKLVFFCPSYIICPNFAFASKEVAQTKYHTMKYTHLAFILLFPFASLFAQVNAPDHSIPDSLEVELDDQEIKD